MTDPAKEASINRRTTVNHSVGERDVPLLHCPKQAQLVELQTCSECADSRGLELDSETKTLRSLCAYSSSNAPKRSSREQHDSGEFRSLRVADVMQTGVTSFTINTPISDVADGLIEGGFSGAPVVDREGRPIGVVSLTDVVRATNTSHRLAGQIMTPACCSLPASAELTRAAALMAFEGIHRVPIVSEEDHVVGIVSALDVMRAVAQSSGFALPNTTPKRTRDQERQDV